VWYGTHPSSKLHVGAVVHGTNLQKKISILYDLFIGGGKKGTEHDYYDNPFRKYRTIT
jgi:hypothetical protein